jgi:hypothetical protein
LFDRVLSAARPAQVTVPITSTIVISRRIVVLGIRIATRLDAPIMSRFDGLSVLDDWAGITTAHRFTNHNRAPVTEPPCASGGTGRMMRSVGRVDDKTAIAISAPTHRKYRATAATRKIRAFLDVTDKVLTKAAQPSESGLRFILISGSATR